MSDVFIVDLFYFQINKYITIFRCIESISYRYTKHMILITLNVFYFYNQNNVHPFSIFYNISIFRFLSLCVIKYVVCKYSFTIVNPVY